MPTTVSWKVHWLTMILSRNVTDCDLFFNIITFVVNALLCDTLLGSHWSKSHQQLIWRHHMNFSAYNLVCLSVLLTMYLFNRVLHIFSLVLTNVFHKHSSDKKFSSVLQNSPQYSCWSRHCRLNSSFIFPSHFSMFFGTVPTMTDDSYNHVL